MKKYIVLMLAGMCAIGAVACKPKANENAATSEKAAVEAPKGDGDKLLAEYQKFADEYVATYKKMKSGDMSAVQDFQTLGKKAQDWAQKVQGQISTWTEAQVKKYQEIGENMAKALQE